MTRNVRTLYRIPPLAGHLITEPNTIAFELHPGQVEVWENRKRFNILSNGRRWGKTIFASFVLTQYASAGHPVAYMAPTYKMMMEFWRTLKTALRPIIVSTNETERRITLIGGGSIDFWSLDSYDSIRGRKYACVVPDECAMVSDLADAWQQAIRPTLTDYKGDAWFMSTPKQRSDFNRMKAQYANDPIWQVTERPTSDNPFISADEIEAARRELPALVFAQEFLGQSVDIQGSLVKREHLRYGEAPQGLRIGMGVDLAISQKDSADYTAVVVVGYDKESGQRYVLDCVRDRVSFHNVVDLVKRMADKWHPARINIESVQYQIAVVQELLRKTSLPVKAVKPDRDKVARFQSLQARYEQGLVTHVRTLPQDFERELLDFPSGEHDDMVDALVYAEQAAVKSQGVGALIV